jgi:hypothetical protein
VKEVKRYSREESEVDFIEEIGGEKNVVEWQI